MSKYQPNSLFCSGADFNLNACIGSNGGPYDYGAFSHGYFGAANHLVDSLRDGGTISLTVDTCVYPIVSCYRHAIELGIKHSIIVASQVLMRNDDFPKIHELNTLWSQFLILESAFSNGLMPDEEREFFSEVIADLSVTDPIGMVFRYPEDRARNLQIDKFEWLNLQNLYESMTRCQSILEDIDIYLSYLADNSCTSSSSARHQVCE